MKEVKSAMKENEARTAPATIKVFARARGNGGGRGGDKNDSCLSLYVWGWARGGINARERQGSPPAAHPLARGCFYILHTPVYWSARIFIRVIHLYFILNHCIMKNYCEVTFTFLLIFITFSSWRPSVRHELCFLSHMKFHTEHDIWV